MESLDIELAEPGASLRTDHGATLFLRMATRITHYVGSLGLRIMRLMDYSIAAGAE